ncbi:MAG: DUF4260 domain-containing protein [Paracoccaceae bacterium]
MPAAVIWQRAEGALVLAAALAVLALGGQPFAWWAAVLIFFAPDLAFAAYLAGPRRGAIVYNAVHLYGFGAAVAALGLAFDQPGFVGAGLLWVGHAGFDRMLGYGLKLADSFQSTHLGRIGKTPGPDRRPAQGQGQNRDN